MWKSVEGWRSAWKNRLFRDQFIVALVALPVVVIVMRVYLEHVEMRNGIVFPDPLSSIIHPVDLNWVIFAVFYSALLLGLVSLGLSPFRFLLTMRALLLLTILRIACLFLLPLDSMPGGIPLSDPMLQLPALRFTGLHGLFFCWESATLALLSMTSRWKDLKSFFVAATVIVSALLLLQQAQYSISLLSGPVFAYAAFRIALSTTSRDVHEVRENGYSAPMTVAVGRN